MSASSFSTVTNQNARERRLQQPQSQNKYRPLRPESKEQFSRLPKLGRIYQIFKRIADRTLITTPDGCAALRADWSYIHANFRTTALLRCASLAARKTARRCDRQSRNGTR